MPVSVLIVDDSSFFRQRLTEIIREDTRFKVIGVAINGRDAVEKTLQLKPDVITMDFEMPLMDGISAVREIMARQPTPILMLSSLTYEGAKVTLDALAAGAMDFMNKNFAEVTNKSKRLKSNLFEKLAAIAKTQRGSLHNTGSHRRQEQGVTLASNERVKLSTPAASRKVNAEKLRGRVELVAIGASTGGPLALTEVLKFLPGNFPVPLLLVQHMPNNFTKAFAERLNSQSRLKVVLAEDDMSLQPGTAYVAPGGHQMILSERGGRKLKILPGDDRLNYRPSVDVTLASAANHFGQKLLAMILTGMGSDGCKGCRIVKQSGGRVWSQDQETSVIYGMPMAVARERLTDKVLPLPQIGGCLADAFCR